METRSSIHDFGNGHRVRIQTENLEDLLGRKMQTSTDSNVFRCVDDGLRRLGNHGE